NYLLPGLIDLHNDTLEKEIEPRPNVFFPLRQAFFSLENSLICNGITTIFHSLSFASGELGVRDPAKVESIIRNIRDIKKKGLINHKVHLRYEITDNHSVSKIILLIEEGFVDLLSFMDHTPGQGQFRLYENYYQYLHRTYNMDHHEVDDIVRNKMDVSELEKITNIVELARVAGKNDVKIASHDDDNISRLTFMYEQGVSICEFPINLKIVREAVARGMYVEVGAPNIIRNKSSAGNLKAIDVIKDGISPILTSDYLPSTLLLSIFKLKNKYPLPYLVKMATLSPAEALGISKQYGSIETGKTANFILVREDDGYPYVQKVFINGRRVFSLYR
ncbi:MAG: alpha-D-ribose 1-methylphosphonate 5-triphosphate diphosphatase, partial [Bacillota bacterium]